jgi:hypothetical protein
MLNSGRPSRPEFSMSPILPPRWAAQLDDVLRVARGPGSITLKRWKANRGRQQFGEVPSSVSLFVCLEAFFAPAEQ